MRGTFLFDAISSLPFIAHTFFAGIIGNHSGAIDFFRIFKLVRLRKIGDSIANMAWSKETKTQLKRLFAIFSLAIITHVQGCLIFIAVDKEKIWIPPLDGDYLYTDLWYRGRDNLYIYSKMLYHSALVFALVDINPRSI